MAGVQALRLEYYELFSRIFAGEGRPFRPWHIPFRVPGGVDMIAWLVGLPVLGAVSAAHQPWCCGAERRSSLSFLRWLNAGLLLSAGALLIVALTAGPSGAAGSAAQETATSTSASGSALLGAAIAVAGSSLGAADRRGLHRVGGPGGDQRAARAVRAGHGDRRAGRGHRDLRADRRGDPDRKSVKPGGP